MSYCDAKSTGPLEDRYQGQSLYDYVARNWQHMKLRALLGPDNEYHMELNGYVVVLRLEESAPRQQRIGTKGDLA